MAQPNERPAWMDEAEQIAARRPRGLLFLCVANSARSQIAEAVASLLVPAGTSLFSAGSQPSEWIRPESVTVMAELGVDIEWNRCKHVDEIPTDMVDTVITLCDEESCPAFLGDAHRVHWGLPDPAADEGDAATRLGAFREVRDELLRRLTVVFDVPKDEPVG